MWEKEYWELNGFVGGLEGNKAICFLGVRGDWAEARRVMTEKQGLPDSVQGLLTNTSPAEDAEEKKKTNASEKGRVLRF